MLERRRTQTTFAGGLSLRKWRICGTLDAPRRCHPGRRRTGRDRASGFIQTLSEEPDPRHSLGAKDFHTLQSRQARSLPARSDRARVARKQGKPRVPNEALSYTANKSSRYLGVGKKGKAWVAQASLGNGELLKMKTFNSELEAAQYLTTASAPKALNH